MRERKGVKKIGAISTPQVPLHFRCPISLELMRDPVILCTGHTYDRSSIETWVTSGNTTCPVTMQKLDDFTLTPNHTLMRLIQAWCAANASLGVQRIPTPKQPADIPTITALLDQISAKSSSGDADSDANSETSTSARCCALTTIASFAKEGRHNQAVIAQAGAVPVLESIVFRLADQSNSDVDDLRRSSSTHLSVEVVDSQHNDANFHDNSPNHVGGDGEEVMVELAIQGLASLCLLPLSERERSRMVSPSRLSWLSKLLNTQSSSSSLSSPSSQVSQKPCTNDTMEDLKNTLDSGINSSSSSSDETIQDSLSSQSNHSGELLIEMRQKDDRVSLPSIDLINNSQGNKISPQLSDTALNAATLIQSLCESSNITPIIASSPLIVRGLLHMLSISSSNPNSSWSSLALKVSLKAIFSLCLSRQGVVSVISIGGPHILIDTLVSFSSSTSSSPSVLRRADVERALGSLELICTTNFGCQSISLHALAIPLLIKLILNISDRATECSIGSLLSLCSHSNKLRDEALHAGIIKELLLLIQSQCTHRAKSKAMSLLKLFQSSLFHTDLNQDLHDDHINHRHHQQQHNLLDLVPNFGRIDVVPF